MTYPDRHSSVLSFLDHRLVLYHWDVVCPLLDILDVVCPLLDIIDVLPCPGFGLSFAMLSAALWQFVFVCSYGRIGNMQQLAGSAFTCAVSTWWQLTALQFSLRPSCESRFQLCLWTEPVKITIIVSFEIECSLDMHVKPLTSLHALSPWSSQHAFHMVLRLLTASFNVTY